MSKGNVYLLYNDKEQSKLLSLAESIEELKFESQFYTGGTWFQYDCIGNKLINEIVYSKKTSFPKNPKKREPFKSDNKHNWIK